MSGYIGTKSVTLSTTSANVGGDSTVGGDLTVDTNTLYVDSTNNRVGVGTASPSNPFQVGTSDLIVDSSGNVGIGTSSPTTKLQSKGGSIATLTDNAGLIANASASFVVNHGNDYGLYTGYIAAAGDAIGIAATRTLGSALPLSLQPFGGNVGIGTSSPMVALNVHDSTNARIALTNSSTGQTFPDGFELLAAGLDAYVQNRSNGNMIFTTNNSERMRLDSSGNLLVSATTTSGFQSSSSESGTIAYAAGGIASNSPSNDVAGVFNRLGTDGIIVQLKKDGTTVGSISVTGSSTSYNTSSDHRLKENVTDVTDGITRVKQLEPKRFNFIADPDTTVDGFLAHEAQAVVPEAITGTHNEVDTDGNPVYQGIDQSKLVPLLTAALKEAITKIETLETEMTSVKARLDVLEGN